VIFDKYGNLYGETYKGGTYGTGTVFELSHVKGGGWTERVLHSFGDGSDGQNPGAGLVFDATGNLYGMTRFGGAYGQGTVFKMARKPGGGWIEKVLHSFSVNGTDGGYPEGSLVLDAEGNLYGTTVSGGAHFLGMAFELLPQADGAWIEKQLHSFDDNGHDGVVPAGNIVLDAAGNLYGATQLGGANHKCIEGCGAVFELSPKAEGSWTELILHSFNNNGDGSTPYAGVVIDGSGNLYGTTSAGGSNNVCPSGCGTVFELSPASGGTWTESILYSFGANETDGISPRSPLTIGASGNLYGSTGTGGAYEYGTVFELTSAAGNWTESILYSFTNDGTDGTDVTGSFSFDTAGNLYGTTYFGGNTDSGGTAFEITP
jgi:uncharacterized repeat protein (TIGR03803 family)